MCGINGVTKNIHVVNQMNEATQHRGPDDQGSIFLGSISLGMNRLAILETGSAGRQPMQTEDGRYTVVFNGEIYNHKELRDELKTQGVVFSGHSDTEVILRGWAHWKFDFIRRLEGMWAFCIHDRATDQLFLSRDPFGIKPLYIYHNQKELAFSSEIRGLLNCSFVPRELDARSIQQVLGLGYILSPQTILSGVEAFLPGEERLIDLKTGYVERTFRPVHAVKREAPSDDELESVLSDSVRRHLEADVPVGIFYSGGIDSTLLAILAKRHHAEVPLYHLAIEGRGDTPYAREIAKRLQWKNVVEVPFSPDEAITWWKTYVASLDQPLADTAFLPLLALTTRARKDVKVALSGEGADELFSGYSRQRRYGFLNSISVQKGRQFGLDRVIGMFGYHEKVKQAYQGVRRRIAALRQDPVESFLYETALGAGLIDFSPLYQDILAKIATNPYCVDQGLALDRLVYLPDDLLVKLDVATMATSLEGRVPFLDKTVFSTVGGAPFIWKNKDGQTKAPLKHLLRRYLPANLVDRKKSGFSLPLVSYFLNNVQIHPAIDWYLLKFEGVNPSLDKLFLKIRRLNKIEDRIKIGYGHLLFGLIVCYEYAERFHL